jgi:hypothetical protein
MRLLFSLSLVAAAAGLAVAQCPPTCTGGGGPATTDCFLAYGNAPGKVITCTEGDPSCDTDGKVDGVCTFGFTACTNATVGSCSATPLDSVPTASAKGTGAEAFTSALAGLSTTAPSCTEPGLVKLAIALSQTKLKPAKLTLKLAASAGGKADKDVFKFVCNPARPGLAADVQPIFTETCTFAGCHSGAIPQRSLSLEAGQSAAGLSQRALGLAKLQRVKPGSLKKSYLTLGLFPGTLAIQMPNGCPSVVAPVTRCLTDAEIYTILAWIQAGAQP